MRFVRFCYGLRGPTYGIVENEHIRPLEGDIFNQYQRLGAALPLDRALLMAPIVPSKIIAVAYNYKSHLGERPQPSQPELFLKPPSAIIGPGDTILIPKGAEQVDLEGELVVVMGRHTAKVPVEEALDYVFGYTCGGDVSARDWQRGDLQWWRAKGSDTFAPLGPWIVTDMDAAKLSLQTRINGRVEQETNTELFIHSIPQVISFASRVMTLEPGDLIFTGTPGSTPRLKKADRTEVEIEGIGVLGNFVDEGV